jgi:transketolase
MRTAFIQQLVEEAKTNDKIFLIVGDLGYSVVEPFALAYPERFLNAGVAEQNMTGIAAGLAKEGYNVFTYSIGNFPTMRCFEQIRYDVCYHNLNVKIISVGGGYAYGPLGPSHHATEDIGTLRVLPNLTVCAPSDPIEARAITSMFCNTNTPGYLRLGKAGEPNVHDSEIDLKWGKGICVKKGEDTAVLSMGSIVFAMKKELQDSKFGLYSFPFIKPFDKELLQTIANSYTNIITVEEHQKNGGFGSVVLEALNDLREEGKIQHIPMVKRIAIPDIYISVAGSQEFLRNKAGLKLF